MDHDLRPPHPLPAPDSFAGPPAVSLLQAVDETAPTSDDPPHPPVFRSRRRLALVLFAATCVSTFIVGMNPGGGSIGIFIDPRSGSFSWQMVRAVLSNAENWINGATYAAAVMAILLTHEMGHYIQARRHRVPATLPYFIPMPFVPFGTMGAVIVQGAGFADRRKLFDIAVSGPLAGLVVALPVTWFGIQMAIASAKVSPAGGADPAGAGFQYGAPLILEWMIRWQLEGTGGHTLQLNPLLFAGWVGIFVTALNLLPVGQLDGGHILYTLIGRPAHYVALGVLGTGVVAMIWFQYHAFALLIVLLVLMGPRHPPTADDTVPLGWGRILVGWLTLAFVIVGFTPQPIIEVH